MTTTFKVIFYSCTLTILALYVSVARCAAAETAYECSSSATSKTFSDAHCKTAGGAAFGHIAIPVNVSKAVTLSNITTGTERSFAKLKSVQSGITLEIQATEVEGTGTLENREPFFIMVAEGKATLKLKNVTVTAPSGKGCMVSGGTITTSKLKITSGGINEWEASAAPIVVGEKETIPPIAKFTVEGCSLAVLNHAYEATGRFTGIAEGATTRFTHASVTTEATFSLSGSPAGLEGSLTMKSGGNGVALT
jgi:hypothetical protein